MVERVLRTDSGYMYEDNESGCGPLNITVHGVPVEFLLVRSGSVP